MSEDDVNAQPWSGRFEPNPDLPDFSEAPTTDERPLSPMDKKFKQIYDALSTAEKEQNPDAYVSALGNLSTAMSQEVLGHYGSQYGDLAHTMMEWQSRNNYFIQSHPAEIKAGRLVTRRSNTLNNQRNPHGVGPWSGDHTDQHNSQSFGEAVTGYLTKRGSDYISGVVIPGRSEQSEPHSVMQVETRYKGFGQPSLKNQGLARLD
jgi:hypothetical protein